MEPVWAALQASGFAAAIRDSTFIYPIANVTHVVAVIAFFGVVATMDFRLLRLSDGEPARHVIARLRPVALIFLIVVASAGFILFAAEPVALARNPVFQVKLVAIGLALANVGLNEWALRRWGEDTATVRKSAALSLYAWLFIAAMGRGIAYV